MLTHVATLVTAAALILDVERQRGGGGFPDAVVEEALAVAGCHQPVTGPQGHDQQHYHDQPTDESYHLQQNTSYNRTFTG